MITIHLLHRDHQSVGTPEVNILSLSEILGQSDYPIVGMATGTVITWLVIYGRTLDYSIKTFVR